MPLFKGKSKSAFSHNIKTEMEHGHPQKQSLAIAYAMKRKGKKMAEGGEVDDGKQRLNHERGVHKSVYDLSPGTSISGSIARHGSMDVAKNLHKEKLHQLKSMEKPKLHGMAEGGDVEHDEHDLVDRIMKKRGYSEGGIVANEDEPLADSEPAEFDDLVLDDHLEEHETDANSGDELGDKRLDEDDHDVVERIMRSRAKKDRLPRPL